MTLQRRRTSWFLTAVALLLSPGAMAPWLQFQHDCDAATAEKPAAEHRHHHDSHRDPSATHGCQCLGVCQTLTGLPKQSVVQTLALVSATITQFSAESAVRSRLIPHLFPFALPPPSFS